MFDFLKQLTDPESIIKYGGLALLLFVVFAETGLFVGFFLPGDNLIFIAGLLCATKPELLNVSYPVLLLLMTLAAILGNVFGFWFGKKAGTALYSRKDSFFFRKSHLETTKAFYEKHGGKTLILGRFIPIIRTFAPIFAGVTNIEFRKFMLYNVIGALGWIGGISWTAFYLGKEFPGVQNHLGAIFISLIVLTAIPLVIAFVKSRKK
jgi:membrane-associated protein